LLEEEELNDAVLAVVANKQDVDNCMSVVDIHKALELETLQNRSVQIFRTSAIKGEGIDEVMAWVASSLDT
jgi:ADP-ribosylation factor-like protein 1